MKRLLLLFFMLLSSITGFCETITITTMGDMFTPDDVTINSGDIVHFTLGSTHNAVEVSLETWNAQGTAQLQDGFQVGFNGNQDIAPLSVGVHYYVCQAHIASMNMKGKITVAALGVNDFQLVKSYSVFPNPAAEIVNVKIDEGVSELNYRITDLKGMQIESGKLNNTSTSVDISKLASGVYFLQLGDYRRQVLRLVKK